MRALPAATIAALLAAGGLILSACQGAGPDELDPDALDTVAATIEAQMNEPAIAIMTTLRGAAGQAQVGWDTLTINLYGEPEPVNWWLQKRGFLELSGAQFATRAVFTLTKPATDMLAQPDQDWFEVNVTGDPKIDCKTAQAIASKGCEVEVEITPVLTAAGKSAIGALAYPLAPMAVTGVVRLGETGDWEVLNLSGGTLTPSELALAAILGDPAARQAAARAADAAMNSQLARLAGEVEPDINLEAYTPPNYIDPPPPAPPLAPTRPSSLPDSPFRPGG